MKVVGILQDLSGPKIRTGRLKGGGPVDLKEGELIRIVAGDGEGTAAEIYTTYAELVRKVRPAGRLLIDDGRVELEVVETTGETVIARVVVEFIRSFSRDWHPKGLTVVILEVIMTVTDPPVKLLRRLIPQLTIGAVRFDLSIMVLLLVAFIGMQLAFGAAA